MKTFRVEIDNSPVLPNPPEVFHTQYWQAPSAEVIQNYFDTYWDQVDVPIGSSYGLRELVEIEESEAPEIHKVLTE